MSETLAGEVASFGMRVVIVEPGPFRNRVRVPAYSVRRADR
jgi:NAD(P)-dependent dehydrogenase (short-subunit alcohol dehydrogenase family)